MNWESLLTHEIEKPYFVHLAQTVKAFDDITPPVECMFSALELVPFDSIKVVIVGQDPYHGSGQANGLAFSVNAGQPLPPSLRNIFSEVESDVGVKNVCGDLTPWAKQGVLLLNTILTVSTNQSGSHAGLGWEQFTSKIISDISLNHANVVFLMWGAYAQTKEDLIDLSKHNVLKSTHPSPLSAHKGFLGCKHFSATNDYLISHGKTPIDWRTK